MRVAPYERLSKDRSGLSENVQIQAAENREYADEKGWRVVGSFSDNDISVSKYGRKGGRPRKERTGYNALLKAIKAGEVDLVLVTEMPRLYREMEELLELIHLAEITPLRGIETTSGNGYDLSTGPGIHNAISAVNNAMAESRQISDRTKRKKRAQAQSGHPSGGRRPYGYNAIPAVKVGGQVVEPARLEQNEAEAAVIQEAAKRRVAGESLSGIVKNLNERGIPSATGTRWHPVALRQILTSHRIKGVRIHNGQEHPAQWEPIIDTETWERLQLIFKSEDYQGGASHASPRAYLLTGICRCGECGNPMVGSSSESKKEGEPSLRRYYCKPRDNSGFQVGCGKVARLAEPIERLVTAAVLDVLDSPQMGKLLAAASENNEMRELIGVYEGQKLKLNELVEDYASGLLNRTQLAHAKAIVEAAMEATTRQMEKIQASSIFASLPPGESIRKAWKDHEDDLHWRQSMISMLVEAVTIHRGRSGNTTWKDPNSDKAFRFDYNLVEIVWRAGNEASA
jgi:site-specific DNA recombinase